MNRNTESYFSLQPSISISRSKFDRSGSVKTTFNTGDIIPFYVDEVLPGDTFNVKTSKVVRMPSLVTPVMDSLFLDTYWFFVPNRLVWSHWKEFCGENTESAWIPETEYSIPQVTSPDDTGWTIGSLADYFGVPTGVPNLSVSALPFRSYALICNEWFRNTNVSDPLVVPTDDATMGGMNDGNELERIALGGMPYRAAKYKDYMTAALPGPQRGPDVQIPIAEAGNFPVVPLTERVDSNLVTNTLHVKYVNRTNQGAPSNENYYGSMMFGNQGTQTSDSLVNRVAMTGMGYPVFDNLWAINEGTAQAATINDLRMAFQIQKFYEKQARSGSRYTEVVRSFFGVISPDARLQRPEYLGGNRVPINITQVVQQSGTVSTGTPQGTVVGLSQTTDVHADFVKSFTEHGHVIGLMVVRYDHTYQQGLNRMWTRKDKFDFYWPVFANIGEQAIKNKEIYAQGTAEDDEVFGYQEAWAEYRYKPSIVTGDMRSNSPRSLDVWHLADYYDSLPALSDSWMREDPSNVNRILAVSDQVAHQFFADIYVDNKVTRPMPLYSIPGFIDHH